MRHRIVPIQDLPAAVKLNGMSTAAADPLLETLVNDFGGNYVFALDLLEMYREDRGSVDPSWRSYFDKATGRPTDGQSSPVTVMRDSPGVFDGATSWRVMTPSMSTWGRPRTVAMTTTRVTIGSR